MKNRKKLKMALTILLGLNLGLSTTGSLVQAQGLDWLFGRQKNKQADEVTEELTDEDLKIITDVYYTVKDYYIEDIPKTTLLEGALKGMVSATGDPYSEFLTAEETNMYEETEEGSFSGVGIQFMQRDGKITVISAIDGTPASDANIQPNDVILKADDTELTGMNTNEVVNLIRGEIGTKVKLTIQRADRTFEVDLERAEIPIVTVEAKVDEKEASIGYVKITQFNGTTYDELQTAVETLREKGVESFVFDLRYNPGGLLDQALKISNMFLEDKQVIMQVEETNKEPYIYEADDRAFGDFQITEPFVLLVNEGSASASEILTGAIKENLTNPIVGTTTFGKGSVQNFTNSSYLGELKLTFAKWLLPSGLWIHDTGIEPTVLAEPEKVETVVALNPEETLQKGDASETIESLGLILNALGYLEEPSAYFDDKMDKAVKAFQADKKLTEDGKVTGDTTYAISDAIQEYFKTHDVQYEKAKEVLQEYIANLKDEAA